MEKGTFENAAATLFNSLPYDIKSRSDYYNIYYFSSKLHKYLIANALKSFLNNFNIVNTFVLQF